jgi:hypothetical protein
VSEHDKKSEEHVEDLDVPESESEDVKGGLLSAQDQIAGKHMKFNKHQFMGKHNPGAGRFGDGSV